MHELYLQNISFQREKGKKKKIFFFLKLMNKKKKNERRKELKILLVFYRIEGHYCKKAIIKKKY